MPPGFIRKGDLPKNSSGNLKLEIKPIGRWNEAVRVISKLSPAIKKASLKAQLKVCNEIRTRVRAHLRNQDLGWKLLSSTYSERKSSLGLDGRTLIAYGNYYHNIEVWQKGMQYLVFVGVKRGKYTRRLNGKRGKLDIATVAAIHEFSSGRKVPRRPLWNPTIREIGGAKGIKSIYLKSFKHWLRMGGMPVTDINKTIKILGWR